MRCLKPISVILRQIQKTGKKSHLMRIHRKSDKRIGVCMLVWKYWPQAEGGAERQCRKLARELYKMGHACTVVTARLSHDKKLVDKKDGVPIYRLGRLVWIEPIVRRWFRSIRGRVRPDSLHVVDDWLEFWLLLPFVWIARMSFLLDLKRFLRLKHDDLDVLHVHEAHWIAGGAGWAAHFFGLPVLCKEAGYPPIRSIGYDTPMRGKLTKYRQFVHYIAMNPTIKDSLIRIGVSREHITIVPNGVELPQSISKITESFQVIYVGNFTQGAQLKAFDVLFKAWVQVVKNGTINTHLLLLGEGDTSHWKNYLKKHGCADRAEFAGRVTDVGPYLKKSRIFVLPSRAEGMSNALLEAMSWGVPPIVSDIPGNRFLVKDNKNGLVVPVGDSEALTRAIERLLVDNELCIRLGREARKTVEKEFSISFVIKRLLNLYKQANL